MLLTSALVKGIEEKPGSTLGDIGHAIREYAEEKGFRGRTRLCGHGLVVWPIRPQVFALWNCWHGSSSTGMFFTIEPMINAGSMPSKYYQTDGPQHWR